jgi:RNA polymerase sigma factor (TIGR02999 family)
MRRILLKHAEKRRAEKRGSGGEKLPLDKVTVFCAEQNLDFVALNEALTQLAEIDAEKARLVELKFFGGLTTEEISEVTRRPVRTVEREWKVARGFLFQRLAGEE